MVLKNSSVLQGRYTIQSVLGEVGPFDVSYLAWDIQDEREVVVREYYPLQFAKRARDGVTLEVHDARNFEYGLGAYTVEAHRLIDIDHPGIVNYSSNFKENGTIYSVSDFVSGSSTYGYMIQQGGALPEEEAIAIMEKVLQGLTLCHKQHLFHGGLWPKAIHLDEEGAPVLIGFSQARFQLARYCGKVDQVLLPGFSAPEQSDREIQHGAHWDVFGSAATLFYLLTGYQLNYQRDHFKEDDVRRALHSETAISSRTRAILEEALVFDTKERVPSIELLYRRLSSPPIHALEAHVSGDGASSTVYEDADGSYPDTTWHTTDLTHRASYGRQPLETSRPLKNPSIRNVPLIHNAPAPMAQNYSTSLSSPQKALDEPDNDTELVHHESSQGPLRLKSHQEPRQPAQQSDKEVTQLLTRMVKWQQRLIAFILGFVFLVVVGVLALFAGPQLLEQLNFGSGGEPPRVAEAQRASAGATSPQTAGSLFSTGDSTGSIEERAVTETGQDSNEPESSSVPDAEPALAAADRETEEAQDPASSASSASSASQQPTAPRSAAVEERRSTEEQSPAPPSREQDEDEANERGEEERDEATIDDAPAGDAPFAENDAPADSLLVANNLLDADLLVDSTALRAQQEREAQRLEEALREREFNMYRTLGDSLLTQGFHDLAMQWYQAALDQDPENLYVQEQINMIENSRSRASQEEDSLEVRIAATTDEQGIFFAPDVLPQLKDKERVYGRITFPETCKRIVSEGRVIAKAVVDEDGMPSNASIVKSLDPACNAEVLRVLGEAEFEPGIFNGEPVKSWYAFSVIFQSDDN